jgi:putative phage-type endonuclease
MKVFDMLQRSDEWFAIRRSKITGSKAKALMSSKWLSLVDSIIAEKFGEIETEDGYTNAAIQRGIDYEPHVINLYETETFQQVSQVGFCLSDDFDFVGLSPDGWVGHNGAIEIKCPNTATHLTYIRQDKIPSDYQYQVMWYFIVNPDLDWLDFVSFDDRFTPEPLWIKRIHRDELTGYDEVIKKLKAFEKQLKDFEIKYSPITEIK